LTDSPAVGLCMIVKNEAHVIERALDSVKDLVSDVLVEDTGSDDGTQQVIRNWLDRNFLPGEVRDVEWRDFAFNRTHALESLREHHAIEYALVLDADDYLVWDSGVDIEAWRKRLVADIVDVEIRYGRIRYWRPQLLKNSVDFRYVGVLHEYVEPPIGEMSRVVLGGVHIGISNEGSRSHDANKFLRDVETLERAISGDVSEHLRARYTFYLAQSLRDSGQLERAREVYLERSTMDFWVEESYYSLYQAGKLTETLGLGVDEAIGLFLQATAVRPQRSEALHAASRLCRLNSRFDDGYWFAKRGLTSEPRDALFLEPWIYDYGMLDELAVNAYWSGRRDEFRQACQTLLEKDTLPGDVRARIEENMTFT